MKVSIRAPRHIRRLSAAEETINNVSASLEEHATYLDDNGAVDSLRLSFGSRDGSRLDGSTHLIKPNWVRFVFPEGMYEGGADPRWSRAQSMEALGSHEAVHVVRWSNLSARQRASIAFDPVLFGIEEGLACLYQRQVEVREHDPEDTLADYATARDTSPELIEELTSHVMRGEPLTSKQSGQFRAMPYPLGSALVKASLGPNFAITSETVLVNSQECMGRRPA